MSYVRVGFAVITVTALSFALLSTASAHARYMSSTPSTAEVVQNAPPQVEIVFSQDIQRVADSYDIQVEKDRGPLVTSGPAVLDDNDRAHLSVPLQPNLTPGRYVVHWKNVSDDDGDPATGAFAFYVRTQPNTVDRANDAQLATVGAEQEVTPGTDQTPGPTAVASGTASTPAASASATSAVATSTRANPTVVGTATSAKPEGGGGHTVLYVTIAVVAIVAVLGAGAAFAYSRRGGVRP